MRRGPRATVERLDQPSAYFNNKVSEPLMRWPCGRLWQVSNTRLLPPQNKRRQFDKDQRDGDDDTDMQADQPGEDPLKDATTLYVGNL